MIALATLALVIAGDGLRQLDDAEVAALPREAVTLDVHGKWFDCSGPRVIDLLAAAGVPVGDKLHGVPLGLTVIAEAADGYRVAFGLGELDRVTGDKRVIAADRCDGKPLDAKVGPWRLVVAGDKRPARSARQLVKLTVR